MTGVQTCALPISDIYGFNERAAVNIRSGNDNTPNAWRNVGQHLSEIVSRPAIRIYQQVDAANPVKYWASLTRHHGRLCSREELRQGNRERPSATLSETLFGRTLLAEE